MHTSRGAGSAPAEGARADGTVPLRRAPPNIHGPRASDHVGRDTGHLARVSVYASPVQRLITELARLPGVGGRTAQRLAFHLLRAPEDEALALADAIREVKARIGL